MVASPPSRTRLSAAVYTGIFASIACCDTTLMALATIGVNYTQLGEKTAQMVMDVLQGQDPASMPVQVLDDLQVTVNTTTAAALGIDPNVFDVSGNGYTAVE